MQPHLSLVAAVGVSIMLSALPLDAGQSVKVFILASQSNMQGAGRVDGDAFDEPVLLIKTAWGGKSLAKDFRPPSSGGEVGPFYTEMLTHVREVLENLPFVIADSGFGGQSQTNDRRLMIRAAQAAPRDQKPSRANCRATTPRRRRSRSVGRTAGSSSSTCSTSTRRPEVRDLRRQGYGVKSDQEGGTRKVTLS